MTRPYITNWETNTFTMTKKFAEEANIIGSEAYHILMEVRSKGFHIVVRKADKPRKACPTRITFKQMETILSCMDEPDARLAELHAVMDAGKGQNNPYEYVRRWFLKNYPRFNEVPDVDDNGHISIPQTQLTIADPLKKDA